MATATPTLTALRIGPADHGRRLKLDEFSEAEFEEGWVYELARGVVEVTEVPRPWHGGTDREISASFEQEKSAIEVGQRTRVG